MWINAGKKAGVGPGDLVGAITGEAGIDSSALGAIKIAETYALVDIADAFVDQVVTALRGKKIRGQRVEMRRDRPRK